MENLVAGKTMQLFGLSYGTDDYPRREIRTWFSMADLNQATMVNPRNCYQNYNAAINCSDRPIHTYLGRLEPRMRNLTYCSAGQLSPLLNDPCYDVIGVGTSVWLAGARGHVYAEGTQHYSDCDRGENGVPKEGSGTLALTGDMKAMHPDFVRGVSLIGYGVSLALGVGVPIPVLNADVLRRATVRDADIFAPVIDYSVDYPQKTGNVLTHRSYAELKSGTVRIDGKEVATSALSSYPKALEICHLLADEIRRGDFLITPPFQKLPPRQGFKSLQIRGES